MHPMAPADELALIRAQITRLRDRERDLQRSLMDVPEGARCGRWSRAEVVTRTLRVFDHRLLPQTLRDDPMFWRERSIRELRCLPVQTRQPANWLAPAARSGQGGAAPQTTSPAQM